MAGMQHGRFGEHVQPHPPPRRRRARPPIPAFHPSFVFRSLVRSVFRSLVRRLGFVRRAVRRCVRKLFRSFVRRSIRRFVRSFVRSFVCRFVRRFIRRGGEARRRVTGGRQGEGDGEGRDGFCHTPLHPADSGSCECLVQLGRETETESERASGGTV